MDYNLLICIATKEWVALDVNEDGKCNRISFDGNDSMKVISKESVSSFCSYILNNFNIDTFSEIETLNIKVVVVSEYTSLIEDLFSQLKGAHNINIIDAKNIIPICVLKNQNIHPGSLLAIKCMEEELFLKVDDNLNISFSSEASNQNSILINPENFSILFTFNCDNLISNEKEIEKIKKELEKKEILISSLKEEIAQLNQQYTQLLTKEETHKKNIENERILVYFQKDQLQFSRDHYIYEVHYKFKKRTIFKCNFLKSDGMIVTNGTKLIIFSEGCYDDTIFYSNRIYTYKAPKDARIFYLVKDNEEIQDLQCIAVLTNPSDNRNDVIEWLKDQKIINSNNWL